MFVKNVNVRNGKELFEMKQDNAIIPSSIAGEFLMKMRICRVWLLN